jgi:hypothetical protein
MTKKELAYKVDREQIFYYLLKNPASLAKLVNEVDNAEKDGHLSEFVTWQESKRLPYLQACIKEALRQSQCTSYFGSTSSHKSSRYAPGCWADSRAIRAQRWYLVGRPLSSGRDHCWNQPLGDSVRLQTMPHHHYLLT